MPASIVTFAVGVICIVIGIINMRGNISSIHSYHRRRVAKENILPFGKMVGLGTVIMGVGIILFSILSAITFRTDNDTFVLIGTVAMIASFVVGMALSFYAMRKYNGGIF